MPAADTSPEAEAVQLAVHRRLGGARRVAIAFDMSLMARELALAGIRRDYPAWPESEVMREFLRRQFPADQIPIPLR